MSALLQQMRQDSPEALWPLVGSAGSSEASVVNSHALSVVGTVGASSGAVPGTPSARSIAVPAAAQFNRLDCTDASLVPGAGGIMAVEAWIVPSSINSTANDIACRWGTGGPSWLLRFTSAGALTLINYNGASSSTLTSTGPAIAAGSLYHVAAYYDGTNGCLVQNGVVVAGPTAMVVPQASTVRPFSLFCQSDTDGGDYSTFHFLGKMGYCAFYRAAVSSTRFLAHYKTGLRNGVIVG